MPPCHHVNMSSVARSPTCIGTQRSLRCLPPPHWTETFMSGTSGQSESEPDTNQERPIDFCVREPRKPAQSFQTIVGASHIRWSRGDCTYLARFSVSHIIRSNLACSLFSAHDGDVKLWDSRNDSAPLTYLSAHLSRVPSNCIFKWLHSGPNFQRFIQLTGAMLSLTAW